MIATAALPLELTPNTASPSEAGADEVLATDTRILQKTHQIDAGRVLAQDGISVMPQSI